MNTTNQAYSVAEFCRQHSISRALFYKLRKEDKAPQTMRVGRRTLVSQESASLWRKAMEVQSNA